MWRAEWKISFRGSKTGLAKFTQILTDPSDCVMLTTRFPALSLARGKFCHGSVLDLDSSMVRAPARKPGGRIQTSVQDRIFPFKFY